MRAVHDEQTTYRFCIGVQYEVEEGDSSVYSKRMEQLKTLVNLLPTPRCNL